MPKNSSAARREQARALAAAENISYTAALRRLDQSRETAVDDPQRPPSAALPYQVRELSPGYADVPASWHLAGWCATAERAAELADALVAWQHGPTRAHVWDHSATTGGPSEAGPVLLHQADADPGRPECPTPVKEPGRYRPPGVGADLAAEPVWLEWTTTMGGLPLARYAVHTWTPEGRAGAGAWSTAAWCRDIWGAEAAGAALGVGVADGRYPWGAITGPNEDTWPERAGVGDRRTVRLLPARAPGEPLMGCPYTAELDDPYGDGLYGWLTCTLERGHVERRHRLAVATEG
ncbi:hypothetical protein GCM10017673_39150 [Streptosporangium violaceochromogenes]|nr:hypothetical protein GCM10017673_39150 [Streptosporangium violaceochromogenes]